MLRANAVGAWDAAAQSLGTQSPIMAAALLTSLVASSAGPTAPLAILLAGAASWLIGLVVVQFSRRINAAGAFYVYITRALGPACGFLVGWMYFFAIFIILIGGTAFLSHLVSRFVYEYLHVNVHWLPVMLLQCLLVYALTLFNVKYSTRAQLMIVMFSALVVTGVAALTIAKGGDHGLSLACFSPTNITPGFEHGLIFALLMYNGFESAACLGEEAEDPRRTIPRAIALTIAFSLVFFTGMAYTYYIAFPTPDAWAQDSIALLTVTKRYVGDWLAPFVFAAVLVDGFAGNVACMNVVTRGALHMAREGVLPRAFSVVHPRYRTPYVTSLLACVVTVLISVAFLWVEGGVETEFQVLLAVGGVLIQVMYLCLAVAGFVFLRRTEREEEHARMWTLASPAPPAPWRVRVRKFVTVNVVPVAAGLVPIAALYGALAPAFRDSGPGRLVPFLSLAWIGLGMLVVAWMVRWRPDLMLVIGRELGANAGSTPSTAVGATEDSKSDSSDDDGVLERRPLVPRGGAGGVIN